ncbi:hypothetical protein D3C76_1160510 [compost metagenome]
MDGQQFHRRDTQLADMLQHIVDHQPGERTAQVLGHRRVTHGEAAYVGLIQDGLVPGYADAMVVAPGVRRVDNLALGDERGAVALIETEVAIGMADGVAEEGFGPLQLADQLLGIRVDQQLVRVETVAVRRVVWAVDAVAIDQPWVGVRQIAVVNLVGVFRQLDAFEFDVAGIIENAQFHLGGIG